MEHLRKNQFGKISQALQSAASGLDKKVEEFENEEDMANLAINDDIKKQYYTIGEVSEQLDLPQSQIRFWETEFDEIKPKKNRKGNRMYTEKDIEVLENIKFLLKIKKYTTKGAQEALKSNKQSVSQERQMRETLIKMKEFLLNLKNIL
jgi:DNA-binding transcriptional MerR regulator